ncbi:uncharacterized protein LOC128857663 [Anastrepha ludens]|uniref:uncharacterized protein LOC128857663 n=1 Tax=Anastrepha ludens TaxID=28586 RepID=UPI0023B11812|nr:uncharacterized protein LOC128857663 [Anastrepha ludens]
MKTLKVSLKAHSDTRWASKAKAVNALNSQIKGVQKELNEISSSSLNSETKTNAKTLLACIDYEFLCFLEAWDQILSKINRVNQALQSKTLSLEKATKLIDGLINSINELRDSDLENAFDCARETTVKMGIPENVKESRTRKKRRLELDEDEDDGPNLTKIQKLRTPIFESIDALLSQLTWRYKKFTRISDDFGFLSGDRLSTMEPEDLKKNATDLALKYKDDLSTLELCSEIVDFKQTALKTVEDLENASLLDLLQMIYDFELQESYPNIAIAIRITLPVSIASSERSFSKLKLIKNYLRSTMSQERLSNMAILSIEKGLTSS